MSTNENILDPFVITEKAFRQQNIPILRGENRVILCDFRSDDHDDGSQSRSHHRLRPLPHPAPDWRRTP